MKHVWRRASGASMQVYHKIWCRKMPHNLWNIKGFIAMYPSCNLLEPTSCHPATHAKPRSIQGSTAHCALRLGDAPGKFPKLGCFDPDFVTGLVCRLCFEPIWWSKTAKEYPNLFAGYPRLAITGVLELLWIQPLDTEIWDGYYCKGMANVRELAFHHFAWSNPKFCCFKPQPVLTVDSDITTNLLVMSWFVNPLTIDISSPYTLVSKAGWWFGTCFFHILGIIIPTD